MRQALFLCFAWFAALALAATAPDGRWQGAIEIPDRALTVVIDVARDEKGEWRGSITLPGLGIKGTPLTSIVVRGTDVAFEIDGPLAVPTYGRAAFVARVAGTSMTGEVRQAGNVTRFSATRIGPAQVEPKPRSTPVTRDVEAEWRGEFELGGYPRHVTLAFANHAGGGATARLVVVGKATTDVPIDVVVQQGDSLRVESPSGIAFEGRLSRETGELRGTIELGSLERPLVLLRVPGGAS